VARDALQTRRKLGPVAWVAAGATLHGLRVHEALQPRQVAEQVAEAEGPGHGRPLQVLRLQCLQHPHCAGSGVAPVGEEGGGVLEQGGLSRSRGTEDGRWCIDG